MDVYRSMSIRYSRAEEGLGACAHAPEMAKLIVISLRAAAAGLGDKSQWW